MLSDLYTPKQLDTFRFAVNNDYFMLINHGAKRTGKRFWTMTCSCMNYAGLKKLPLHRALRIRNIYWLVLTWERLTETC